MSGFSISCGAIAGVLCLYVCDGDIARTAALIGAMFFFVIGAIVTVESHR